ncbi:MAG: MnhB domain-containing protein [Atribacterota bacterium]|nr:MnhB domain-containing protein [Atribacterota bacterium]MDD4895281.1 MnhB domain-containing protein [Atribacterota bacterium]MDD5636605.1 MnhB domain-containing protein [Atribacterota bacterium]
MREEMSRIVRTITNLIYGFIAVYGFYVIIHGHLTPGGGFQGGAIVASAFALLLVTYGNKNTQSFLAKDILSLLESTGLVLFITFAFFGLGATFFYNFLSNSGGLFGSPATIGVNPGDLNTGGTITLMNMAVGLEVLAALGVIVLTMSVAAETIQKKEKP